MLYKLQTKIFFLVFLVASCSPAQDTNQAVGVGKGDGSPVCIQSFSRVSAISDADSAIASGDTRLLAISTSGETISLDLPGVGGHLDMSKKVENAHYFKIMEGYIQFADYSPTQEKCLKAQNYYAATYNEQVAFRRPRQVIQFLIAARACRIRQADIEYLMRHEAKPPSPSYVPLCSSIREMRLVPPS